MVLALPSRCLERLEAPLLQQPALSGGRRDVVTGEPLPASAFPSASSRRIIAVFVSPFEASRLGIPSCLQYIVPAHAAHRFLALFDVELAL